MALQKNKSILKKIDTVIFVMRDIIMKDTRIDDIPMASVAEKTEFIPKEISFYFKLGTGYVVQLFGQIQQANARFD